MKHNYVIGGAIITAIGIGFYYVAKHAQVVIKDPKIALNVSPADLVEMAKGSIANMLTPQAQEHDHEPVAVTLPPLAPVVNAEHGTVDPAAAVQDASKILEQLQKTFSPFKG